MILGNKVIVAKNLETQSGGISPGTIATVVHVRPNLIAIQWDKEGRKLKSLVPPDHVLAYTPQRMEIMQNASELIKAYRVAKNSTETIKKAMCDVDSILNQDCDDAINESANIIRTIASGLTDKEKEYVIAHVIKTAGYNNADAILKESGINIPEEFNTIKTLSSVFDDGMVRLSRATGLMKKASVDKSVIDKYTGMIRKRDEYLHQSLSHDTINIFNKVASMCERGNMVEFIHYAEQEENKDDWQVMLERIHEREMADKILENDAQEIAQQRMRYQQMKKKRVPTTQYVAHEKEIDMTPGSPKGEGGDNGDISRFDFNANNQDFGV